MERDGHHHHPCFHNFSFRLLVHNNVTKRCGKIQRVPSQHNICRSNNIREFPSAIPHCDSPGLREYRAFHVPLLPLKGEESFVVETFPGFPIVNLNPFPSLSPGILEILFSYTRKWFIVAGGEGRGLKREDASPLRKRFNCVCLMKR